MKANAKSSLTLAALLLATGGYLLYRDGDEPAGSPTEATAEIPAILAPPDIQRVTRPQPRLDAQSVVDAIDWSQCADDVYAPECAAAVDELISQTPFEGESWAERFATFQVDLERVDTALQDPVCDVRSWSPELAGRCGADAFHNVAVLLDACPWGTDNSLSAQTVETINADGLLSDVGQLDGMETADRFNRLQSSWLRQKCLGIVGETVKIDRGDTIQVTDELHASRGAGAWADYISRATLLGDLHAAPDFLTASKQQLEPFKPGDLDVLGDQSLPYGERVAAARAALKHNVDAWETEVRPVVERVLEAAPATGYKLLAELEARRYPELEMVDHLQQFPDEEDIYPLIPKDDPELITRAENIVVYKLAAMKLEGTDLNNLDDTTIEFLRRSDEDLGYAFKWADVTSLHTLIARADLLASP